jgi:hypothetical protein
MMVCKVNVQVCNRRVLVRLLTLSVLFIAFCGLSRVGKGSMLKVTCGGQSDGNDLVLLGSLGEHLQDSRLQIQLIYAYSTL